MNYPLYNRIKYEDFETNYENDFKQWRDKYPSGTELHFLKEIKKHYLEYFDGDNFEKFVKLRTPKEESIPGKRTVIGFDQPDEFYKIKEVFHIEFSKIIQNRVNQYIFDNEISITESFFGLETLIFQPYESIFLNKDLYVIDYHEIEKYTPFLNIEVNKIFDLKDYCPLYIHFDGNKFKDFEYSCERILKFINRKIDMLNIEEIKPLLSDDKINLKDSHNNIAQPTTKENQNLHSEIFANNGFELFEYILNNHIADKGERGRYADISFYYWKMYTNTPQYINQRPEVFKRWFCKLYSDNFEKIKTLNDVTDQKSNRERHYATSLDWFKNNTQV